MLATSAKAEVVRSSRFICHSFCHSVSVLDYCKNNQPISLKLGIVNWLTFGGDRHYGDFRRFISISHTVTGRSSRHSAK